MHRALSQGIDAISISAARTPARRTRTLSNPQILGLLESSVRSFSNLEEALHHSHYWYVLIHPDAFVALKYIGPLLLLPALGSLLLRALAHTINTTPYHQGSAMPLDGSVNASRTTHTPAIMAAFFAALAAHLLGAVLLLSAVAGRCVQHVRCKPHHYTRLTPTLHWSLAGRSTYMLTHRLPVGDASVHSPQ